MILLVGALFVFAGLAVAARTLLQPKRVSRLTPAEPIVTKSPIADVAAKAGAVVDGVLDGDRRKRVERMLEQSDIDMKPGEAVAFALLVLAALLVLGTMLAGVLLGVLLAGFSAFGIRTVLLHRRDRRATKFTEQLPDLLQLLSGNLRVGYGLLQAIETATRETESPVCDELQRATAEVRLGRDLADALRGIAERVHSDDFEWVVQAITINREIGGDLAEVLDSVADTIRARAHLARQVQTLSAEGRLSARVMLALPIFVGFVTSMINRTYAGLLFGTPTGIAMLGVSGVLMTCGWLWLRRLVRPVY